MNLKIYVIDHRHTDFQPEGPIIRSWGVEEDDLPGPRYADFCALYEVWQKPIQSDLIGFFGYRKYLGGPVNIVGVEPAHAPNWYKMPKEAFDIYREAFQFGLPANPIKYLLAQYDILQAAPFPIEHSIFRDFAYTRSMHDASVLNEVLGRHNYTLVGRKIFPYLFITRWPVFDRMMREMEPIRLEVDPLITAEDSTDGAYTKRPMAYVMERVYSTWLQASNLSIKEMPLIHCWEMN